MVLGACPVNWAKYLKMGYQDVPAFLYDMKAKVKKDILYDMKSTVFGHPRYHHYIPRRTLVTLHNI
eukprot:11218961-Heterocapsa_arctica.AAC.1